LIQQQDRNFKGQRIQVQVGQNRETTRKNVEEAKYNTDEGHAEGEFERLLSDNLNYQQHGFTRMATQAGTRENRENNERLTYFTNSENRVAENRVNQLNQDMYERLRDSQSESRQDARQQFREAEISNRIHENRDLTSQQFIHNSIKNRITENREDSREDIAKERLGVETEGNWLSTRDQMVQSNKLQTDIKKDEVENRETQRIIDRDRDNESMRRFNKLQRYSQTNRVRIEQEANQYYDRDQNTLHNLDENQEKSNKKTKSLLKEVKKEENGQIRRNKLEKLIRSLHQDQKDLIYSKEEDLRKRREDEVIKSLLEKNSKLRSRIENKQDREVQKNCKIN